jgi:hypothetical protein
MADLRVQILMIDQCLEQVHAIGQLRLNCVVDDLRQDTLNAVENIFPN